MCGRYSLTGPNPAKVRERFALGDDIPVEQRFNVAPGTDVVAVTTDREGAPRGDLLRWGLVPHWAESPKVGYKMINARAETLAERPAFRDALATRRCLIVADGFYEWQPRKHGPKLPWWITRADHEPFAFAGLWALWRPAPDVEPLRSCTIITTEATASLREVHGRMPVILEAGAEAAWLDHGTAPGALADLLAPFEGTTRIPVSTAVNDAAHDAPDCIEPVDPGPDEPASATLF
jgi:putative SOS response-associated peptidase YedK